MYYMYKYFYYFCNLDYFTLSQENYYIITLFRTIHIIILSVCRRFFYRTIIFPIKIKSNGHFLKKLRFNSACAN